MGIPKFYRWLSERYPLINQEIYKYGLPEIDNLYLDMNSIIHQSANKDTLEHVIPHISPGLKWETIWLKVFQYIETLFQIVQPKKLLYMALDGVAPRSKINQQRSRRFKSSSEFIKQLKKQSDEGENIEDWFDGCQISPGTSFMLSLTEQLEKFIRWKMHTDEHWRGIEVILSGTDVPGEGEHKIMRYIRNNKQNPNIRHCLYGLDADLILLALIIHDPHTIILREKQKQNMQDKEAVKGKVGDVPQFTALYISILREYLQLEFKETSGDLEKLIDDFLVLMLFIGNDFLPRLPTFEVDNGGIDYLIALYKEFQPKFGYLSSSGTIIWENFNKFVFNLPDHEYQTLRDRFTSPPEKSSKEVMELADNQLLMPHNELNILFSAEENASQVTVKVEVDDDVEMDFFFGGDDEPAARVNVPEAQNIREVKAIESEGVRRVKEIYYRYAFGLDVQQVSEIEQVVAKYLEGLQWVMLYYFQGCQDWQWYYPYHYAPMISDFSKLQISQVTFQYRPPYKAVEQLFGIIHPMSLNLLPQQYQDIANLPQFEKLFSAQVQVEHDILCNKFNYSTLVYKVPFVIYEEILPLFEGFQEEEANRIRQDYRFLGDRQGAGVLVEWNDLGYPSFYSTIFKEPIDYDESLCLQSELIPGTIDPGNNGFPSILKISDITTQLISNIACIFLQQSRLQTLCILMPQNTTPIQSLSEQFLGKAVKQTLPLIQTCFITAFITQQEFIQLQAGSSNRFNNPDERLKLLSNIDYNYKVKHGILINPVPKIAVQFKTLVGYGKNAEGEIYPVWSDREFYIPIELLRLEEDSVFTQTLLNLQNIEHQAPIGALAIVKGENFYGALGQIQGYTQDKVVINLQTGVDRDITPVDTIILSESNVYIPSNILSSRLNSPIYTLNKLAGSFQIRVKIKDKTRYYEFGLGLIDYYNNTIVSGWSRRKVDGKHWEFSPEAVKILEAYKRTFPQFWERVEALQKQKFPPLSALFQYAENAQFEAAKVAMWVYRQPCSGLLWAPLGSVTLGNSAIDEISQYCKNEYKPELQLQISAPLNDLIVNSFPWFQYDDMNWKDIYIGHKVIYICQDWIYSIPFGSQGVVVTLYSNKFAEVVFSNMVLGYKGSKRSVIVPCYKLLPLAASNLALQKYPIETFVAVKKFVKRGKGKKGKWKKQSREEVTNTEENKTGDEETHNEADDPTSL